MSSNCAVIAAHQVRRALTVPGDIRSDIDFQNDINRLLARIAQVPIPFRCIAPMISYHARPSAFQHPIS
jgi:hypothetical protein